MKHLWIAVILLCSATPVDIAAFSETQMGYSMPSTAPLYPEGPFEYRDSWAMSIVFKTTPEVLKELVPEPLKPNADNLMSVFVATFHAAGVGPYHEAGIVVPSSFQGMEGRYTAYMYLDKDSAIAAGREIWGYPKKEARFSVMEKDGMIRAVVERGGVEIIKTSVILGDLVKEPEKLPQPKPGFNLKIIPSVRQGARPDVHQITSNTLQNYRVLKAYKGNATVEFGTSPADPLHRIKVEQILGGSYSQIEFDLTYGEVLYDYLSR